MLDILIKNGAVVDGTGKPAFKANVGIAAGHIAVVVARPARPRHSPPERSRNDGPDLQRQAQALASVCYSAPAC